MESHRIDLAKDSTWTPVFNDPLYLRWSARRLGKRRRLSLLKSYCCLSICTSPVAFFRRHFSTADESSSSPSRHLLRSALHLFALLTWLLISGYLLTELTSTLATFCPDSGDDWLLLLVLFLIGTYAFTRLYLLESILFLPVFAVPLLALLCHFDRRLTRVVTLDLTDEQLAHYSLFKHRMAALGTCKVALTLASALLHVAAAILLLLLFLHGVSWLLMEALNRKKKQQQQNEAGKLFSVHWRRKSTSISPSDDISLATFRE